MKPGSLNTPEQLQRRERNGLPFADLEDMYISGAETKAEEIAEWEENSEHGKRFRFLRGHKDTCYAPDHASRYLQKTFRFSNGVLQELTFRKSDGGVFRVITSETALFVLKGTASVSVGSEVVELGTEDAVIQPSGVLRGSEDAVIIAWTVQNTFFESPSSATVQDVEPGIIRKSDRVERHLAEWVEDGKHVVASSPEELAKAPNDAIRLRIDRYNFVGNIIAIANGFKGGPTYEYTSLYDNFLYIRSGSYTFVQDDIVVDVKPGDVVREIAGHYHHWTRHEDSSFLVTTSLPAVPCPQ